MATQLRVLPRRVLDDSRTAGFIDAEGIVALLDGGFIQEAIYPVAKAYDASPRQQEYFFTRLIPVLQERDEDALADFLRVEAASIGAADADVRKRNFSRAIRGSLTRESLSVRVRVAQLIQWNRLGRDEWRERVKRGVWACQRKGVEPVLVAYAIFIALPEIIRRIGSCYVLNPGWIGDPANPYCGLCLTSDDPNAFLIEKMACLPTNPCIIDDTIRSGRTLNDMRQYLASCGNPVVTPYIIWDARLDNRKPFPVDGSAILTWTDAP